MVRKIHIEAPSTKAGWLSSEEAAKWFGVSESKFDELAQAEGWITPTYFGTSKRWHIKDVAVLSYVLSRRVELNQSPRVRKKADSEEN